MIAFGEGKCVQQVCSASVSSRGGVKLRKDVHEGRGSKEKQKNADKGGRGSKIPEILRTSFMNGPLRGRNHFHATKHRPFTPT